MATHYTKLDGIGILDTEFVNPNPLNGKPYSQQYRDLASGWQEYPVYAQAGEIIDSLAANQITFVVAGTGSGKTVIVPKLALHYTAYQGNVAVTLPKRLVTQTSAEYAAATLDVELGTYVGYIHKGSQASMASDANRLVYMTDGTMFVKFVQNPLLSKYAVIIIDEAHERRIQIDMLLLLLKNLLQSGNRPDLRVIIMSATIDADKYQSYFDGITSQIIRVPGGRKHHIKVEFLNTMPKSYTKAGFEKINEIMQLSDAKDKASDILFFIATSKEAIDLCRRIKKTFTDVFCIEVYRDMNPKLKSYATSADKYQELGAFSKKVVMATNIAESSITIHGLKYVIDSGYELFSRYDPAIMGYIFEKKLISQAQALQRRGRVGRTQPGVCYHLMTETDFQNLAPYPVPDIWRQDITIDILGIMMFTPTRSYQDAYIMINQLMDPPHEPQIESAKSLLEKYQLMDQDGVINARGEYVLKFAALPLNRSLFLLEAYHEHCAKEAAIIIAFLEIIDGKISSLMRRELGAPAPEVNAKFVERKSDHMSLLKIYQNFQASNDPKEWCHKNSMKYELLSAVRDPARRYYSKILALFRDAKQNESELKIQQGGDVTDPSTLDDELRRRLNLALRRSHRHKFTRKNRTIFPERQVEVRVANDSLVMKHVKKREFLMKVVVYDELNRVPEGDWETSIVTMVD